MKRKPTRWERQQQRKKVARKRFQARLERIRHSVDAITDEIMKDRDKMDRMLDVSRKAMDFLVAARANLLNLSRWA